MSIFYLIISDILSRLEKKFLLDRKESSIVNKMKVKIRNAMLRIFHKQLKKQAFISQAYYSYIFFKLYIIIYYLSLL